MARIPVRLPEDSSKSTDVAYTQRRGLRVGSLAHGKDKVTPIFGVTRCLKRDFVSGSARLSR